jgi:hypothetical protein
MRKTDVTKPVTPFDKSAAYKSHIEPLVTELVRQCTIYNIPMFVTCCVRNDETKTEFKNQAVAPDAHELNLADDNIQKHMCIQLGFDTIYRSEDNFDFEDNATKIST